jgi:mRNA-degrading endonuclease RelE of RelBE toxin-antitoxin system
MRANPTKVAIASDFLKAFARIPRQQQSKVLEFVSLFRENPASPGIHYEKITKAKDPNLRSVRIDQAYRGVVLRPAGDKVFVLLWVDHHDKAYQWAESKTFQIHPETGSLQVVEIATETAATPPVAEAEPERGLFDDVRNKHLLRLGVPEPMLDRVRAVASEAELDALADTLPQEAYEALFFLSAGYSLEEVFREVDKTEAPAAVNTNDYAAALENEDSKRRFYVVEEEMELKAILNAPLENWRIFLHPSQRKLVERSWKGPVRVLGGAGTGKTVVAMHRAKWLVQNVLRKENDRILFTTFTRNLAADILENLNKICSREVLRRIEVVNLDRWVANFLKRSGYRFEIDYGRRTQELWKRAVDMAPADLSLPPSFYREEWERVIQPQGIVSANLYCKARRVGRGVRLNRAARVKIWSVFEEYRTLLDENGIRESDDAMRDARLLLQDRTEVLPYRSVLVDEAQDMGPQAFMLLRQIVAKGDDDLFIVGDAHQRIYRHEVVLGQCGVDIRGRGRRLKINYRTTDETRRWAVSLLKNIKIDDMDGGLDDQKGYKSLMHGDFPAVKHFENFSDEVAAIVTYIQEVAKKEGEMKNVCLVTRTNSLLERYEKAINEKGLETFRIRRSEAEDRTHPGLRLATMHRVKGLEFDHIIVASLNKGVIPLDTSLNETTDPVVRRQIEQQERALLYVASTRARKAVFVTSYGERSELI